MKGKDMSDIKKVTKAISEKMIQSRVVLPSGVTMTVFKPQAKLPRELRCSPFMRARNKH